MTIAFTILGQCYSMKNSKTLTMRGGKLRTIKSTKAQQFARDFWAQCPGWARGRFAGDVAVTVKVFYPSRRQDLDAELVYDLLQDCAVIENDRQIVEKHAFKFLDPGNPRVEIQIQEKTQ